MSISGHPQANNQSQVTIKTVGQIMRIFTKHNRNNWVMRTPNVEFAINSAPCSATPLWPFKTSLGYLSTASPVAKVEDVGVQ
mgnify:CR=1 FL=1